MRGLEPRKASLANGKSTLRAWCPRTDRETGRGITTKAWHGSRPCRPEKMGAEPAGLGRQESKKPRTRITPSTLTSATVSIAQKTLHDKVNPKLGSYTLCC